VPDRRAGAPALAAGPSDGVWAVVESHPISGVTSYVASITQNDGGLETYGCRVVVRTFRIGGQGRIGVGVLAGNGLSGELYDENVAFVGTLHISFTSPMHTSSLI
jgi:hypothetical protein